MDGEEKALAAARAEGADERTVVQVRLTPAEKKRLARNAEEAGRTLSGFVRERAVYAPDSAPRADPELLRSVSGASARRVEPQRPAAPRPRLRRGGLRRRDRQPRARPHRRGGLAGAGGAGGGRASRAQEQVRRIAMTIVKQTTVTSSKHARNLRDYIDGKEAVLRGSLNVVREGRWFEEMAETRARAGHDRPSRNGP